MRFRTYLILTLLLVTAPIFGQCPDPVTPFLGFPTIG